MKDYLNRCHTNCSANYNFYNIEYYGNYNKKKAFIYKYLMNLFGFLCRFINKHIRKTKPFIYKRPELDRNEQVEGLEE